MEELLYLGNTTGTHGLKGELKLHSDFERVNDVLKIDNILIIDNKEYKIRRCKYYKNNYLVVFYNYEDINKVEELRDRDVYFKRSLLNLKDNEYLYQDLIGFSIYEDEKYLGKVINIKYNNSVLLEVSFDKKYYLIFNDYYIKEVLLKEKKIIAKNIEGLIV